MFNFFTIAIAIVAGLFLFFFLKKVFHLSEIALQPTRNDGRGTLKETGSINSGSTEHWYAKVEFNNSTHFVITEEKVVKEVTEGDEVQVLYIVGRFTGRLYPQNIMAI